MNEVEVREKESGFANERKESQAMVRGIHGFIIDSQAPKRCLCFKKSRLKLLPPTQRLPYGVRMIVQPSCLGGGRLVNWSYSRSLARLNQPS